MRTIGSSCSAIMTPVEQSNEPPVRSRHAGMSWIAALGLVMDTAALLCATVSGAEGQ
jgi:hypothetical protein